MVSLFGVPASTMGYNMEAHRLALEVTVWNKASKKETDKKDKQFIPLAPAQFALCALERRLGVGFSCMRS
jgi:hypothetical protein